MSISSAKNKIAEAKKEIMRWESLVKVARKLGFHLSVDGQDYVIVPNAFKRHITVMLNILERNGFRKNYLVWHLEDMDDAVTFVAGIAMSQGKVLDIDDNDKWVIVEPEKFSAKELKN